MSENEAVVVKPEGAARVFVDPALLAVIGLKLPEAERRAAWAKYVARLCERVLVDAPTLLRTVEVVIGKPENPPK